MKDDNKKSTNKDSQNGKSAPRGRKPVEAPEFEQKMIDLARVTRVTKGGKRLNFRACMVIGDRKNRVGFGIAKGKDVSIAINKAVSQAKKNLIKVVIKNETIPHEIHHKFKAAKILLKPAAKGRGLSAGGAARAVLELSGIPNITAKIMGSSNKINNVRCAWEALSLLRAKK